MVSENAHICTEASATCMCILLLPMDHTMQSFPVFPGPLRPNLLEHMLSAGIMHLATPPQVK